MRHETFAQQIDVDLLQRPASSSLAHSAPTVHAPALISWRVGATTLAHTVVRSRRDSRERLASEISSKHADQLLRLAVGQWLRDGTRGVPFVLASALDRLATAATPRADAPAVTVVVCTRATRDAALHRALAAIDAAMGAHDELLVVRNAPDEPLSMQDRVALARQWPRARFVDEPRPGLSWARNRALETASHDLVAFTDDDCVPDIGWLDAIRATMSRNPEADILTGRVEPLAFETAAQWQFEAYRGFPGRSPRRWFLAPDHEVIASLGGQLGAIGAGANFVVRRRVVRRIGGFDAALGAGTLCGGGEDIEYFFRALKAGAVIVTTPDAMVRHEHRRDADALERQLFAWSRGFACAIERITRAHPEERAALRRFRSRVATLHHGRRALWSSWRRLARAEWSGMRHAERVYDRARRDAEQLMQQIVSGTADAPPQPVSRPHESTHIAVPVSIDVTEPIGALDVGEHVDRVSLTMCVGAQVCGSRTLRAVHGSVGADRVLDALNEDAGPFAATLLGASWRASRSEAHHWLQRAVASSLGIVFAS